MWMFWIVAGLLAAAACALVIAAAGRAAARASAGATEDPALGVYRRHLADLDEQARQGLLGPADVVSARTEAARRLLKTADTLRQPERPGGRRSRLLVAGGGVLAAAAALAIYMILGSPGLPDQPYRRRLEGWRQANPATLDPSRMAALLREIAKARPDDPQAFEYLGRAELASGDAFAAARAFGRAARLAPGRADLYAEEGEALAVDADGKIPSEAQAAFAQALRIDPKNVPARYFLGRARIAAGDASGGLAQWRALAADLSPDDPRRKDLLAEIASGGAPSPMAAAPAAADSGTGDAQARRMAFIQQMVARQAAQLKAHPNDPEGWARLVRSYGVLGERDAQMAALAEARRRLAGQPDALKQVEAEAPAH